MNKRAIFILGLIVLFFGSAYATTKITKSNDKNIAGEEIVSKQKEENINRDQEIISTSAEEVKITPNTILVLKKYYEECGHTMIDNAQIPEEMVNFTEEELAKKYTNWEIEEFSKDKVVLLRKLQSFCGEHYLLIAEDGVISIYMLDEENNRTLMQTTDIAYEYLPETDKIILNNGIYVYGKEELNKIREDFES